MWTLLLLVCFYLRSSPEKIPVPSASLGCGSGPAEVCAVYIYPLILHHLSVLPLPKDHRVALIQSLFKLLWKGQSPLVRGQVCYQRPRDGGLGMPDLESHQLAERLSYLGRSLTTDAVWSFKVGVAFPDLRLYPKANGRHRPRDEPLFVIECRRALQNLGRVTSLGLVMSYIEG